MSDFSIMQSQLFYIHNTPRAKEDDLLLRCAIGTAYLASAVESLATITNRYNLSHSIRPRSEASIRSRLITLLSESTDEEIFTRVYIPWVRALRKSFRVRTPGRNF